MELRVRTGAAAAVALGAAALFQGAGGVAGPAVVTTYAAPDSRGLMVTSGGWAYCEQVRSLARRMRYTLLCGRYTQDGYTGHGLRALRQLDWGNPAYLAALAEHALTKHRHTGGRLVLLGVSYSGYGVAALVARHPELRPQELIVIDSYLDLVARRAALPPGHATAHEIDAETGGSTSELTRRSVGAAALARLVRNGTRLTAVWTVSDDEARVFNGATCGRDATAATLSRVAGLLGHPVEAWVTRARHGVNLWRYGTRIVSGKPPGRRILLRPGGGIPPDAVCRRP
jgi:pimeloyl-ACP methyl ester carboxylesterase